MAVFSRVVPLPSSVILALPDPAKTAVKPPGAFQVSCIYWRRGLTPPSQGTVCCVAPLCTQLGVRPGHIGTALYGTVDSTAVRELLLVADQEDPGCPEWQHAGDWLKLIPTCGCLQNKRDLTAMNGHILLLEFMEERPLLLGEGGELCFPEIPALCVLVLHTPVTASIPGECRAAVIPAALVVCDTTESVASFTMMPQWAL